MSLGHLAVLGAGSLCLECGIGRRGTGMAASEDACFIKTFRAKIVPERLRSFVMPADGIVSNWIPADGRVQKDTIIATVNEDEIELERKELEVKF